MITLRPTEPGDGESLGRLFTASRELLTFLPRLHSPQEDVAFITDRILPAYRVIVAEAEGRVAGYLAEAPGWIEQLYVQPVMLRRGVGSALLVDAQRRHSTLELWCFAENARGRAFYERHGFEVVEETDGSGNDEHTPDLRYRWASRAG